MQIILSLFLVPIIAAVLLMFVPNQKSRAVIVRISVPIIIVLSLILTKQNFSDVATYDLSEYEWIKYAMLVLEALMVAYITFAGIKSKRFLVVILAIAQFAALTWFEFTKAHDITVTETIVVDKLALIMVLIVSIIGGLICIYAIEYMKDYHHHHTEFKDRRNMFFPVLFVFMSAMFALFLCNDLTLLLFFWEVTTLCSFLLIGYTRTEEAVRNSFRALTINVFGGVLFTIGIIVLGINYQAIDINSILLLDGSATPVLMGVFLICVSGLTKSAQLPFSSWLLGAMVAPTPTSAMLHSSTMVKAGVYIILRMAPLLGANAAGITIMLIGGVTFIVTAIIAISQSDAKKILAYSTISNLGLIVTCAAIDTAESMWAAIMLIIFHAIAKSLLFLSVGSTEHQLGSRNVEDMDGLYKVSTKLAFLLIIGIAGMFVAPFGMLISKWAAMKAFLDSNNIVIVLMIAFGSSATLFFWTKWMGKLIENFKRKETPAYIMRNDEKVSLYSLAAMVVLVCLAHPILSSLFVAPYIDQNMHITFVSPINSFASTIIIFMMCMLFIIPLILLPFYKKHPVKETSVYLAGQNTGDNDKFYGSIGEVRDLQLRNWYMEEIFGEKIWTKDSTILCILLLVIGLVWIIVGGIM